MNIDFNLVIESIPEMLSGFGTTLYLLLISGFLGLILAVLHCAKVHVYEFVPSMRLTKRCHYYDEQQNLGCTIGDWHPLAAEKGCRSICYIKEEIPRVIPFKMGMSSKRDQKTNNTNGRRFQNVHFKQY